MSNQSPEDKSELDEAEQDAADTDQETSAAADQDGETELTLEEALERLSEAEQETARAREDLLRVQADMQNLHRRTEQDIEKAHKYALERFATELLSVMDNLERAVAAAADSDDARVKAILEGVDLTQKSLAGVFGKFNIEAIDPEGEPFDPQLHQAMSIQENAEVEPDTVIAVMQKGYLLNGRVIRPAMVIVAKEAAPSDEKDE